jgi:hypothetical protein
VFSEAVLLVWVCVCVVRVVENVPPQASLLEGGGTANAVTEGGRVENVPLEHFQGYGDLVRLERESGLVRSPSKSCRFSHPLRRAQKYAPGCFAVCGQRQGLLALDLGSIFLQKLLHQKNLLSGET